MDIRLAWTLEGLAGVAECGLTTTEVAAMLRMPNTLQLADDTPPTQLGFIGVVAINVVFVGTVLIPGTTTFEIRTVRGATTEEVQLPLRAKSSQRGQLWGLTVVTDTERATIETITGQDLARSVLDDGPMGSKTLRVPLPLIRRAEARKHPKGFSGVVRDALVAYFAEPDSDQVEHALWVLRRALLDRDAN